jgi:hypothetical protein
MAGAIRFGVPTPSSIAMIAKKPYGKYKATFAMKSHRLSASAQLSKSARAAGPRQSTG